MADFKTRIDDLTGFASTDDTALSDWLSAGARSVMNVLPLNKLERVASNENFTNNIDVEGKKILAVVRKDNNHASKIYTPCRKLPPSMMGRVNDTNYMEAASESDPAYIIQNDVLNTYPGSNASNDSRVVFVNSSITVAHGDSAIANFPDEAEEAVVLYGARNALNRLMNGMNAISALTVSVSAPSAPSISTVSYSAATNADSSATGVATVSVGSVTDVDPTGSVPTYTKPTTTVNFGNGNNFDTLLGTNEDVELASVEIQKQRELLSQYQTDIQNELNEFNKDNVRYQAEMQDEIAKHNTALQRALTQAQIDAREAQQEAQQATSVDLANKAADQALALQNAAQTMAAAIQNNDDILVKFNSEIQKYSAQVADEVQEYSANLQKDIAKYQWYEKQYAMIDARYKEQIQTLQGAL
tara:strand:- start:111 stop:1355 length:1245 start_codon:yes stop_codon:yes gene_type:complete